MTLVSPKHLILLGPPGGGKGTQARLLQHCLGHRLLGMGDLLRDEIAEATPLGEEVQRYVDAGHLVPTPLLMQILEREIAATPPHQGVIFDGVPRSLDQAVALERLLAHYGRRIDLALLLDVPDDVVRARLLARGRSDDTPALIDERLRIYRARRPQLEHFYAERGVLVIVKGDGEASPEVVFERIRQAASLVCKEGVWEQ